MSSSEQAFQPSPWISVWLKPRRTIANILAERPQRGVLLLGSLSVIAGTLSQLLGTALRYRLFDWRIAAGFVIACAIAGLVGLYISAFAFKWSGRLLGGRASAAELRAVVAWGLTPSVLGLAIALVLVAAASVSGAGNDVTPAWIVMLLRAIVLVCGIWSRLSSG
jgi:xanthosine utilization system XapX-like protein